MLRWSFALYSKKFYRCSVRSPQNNILQVPLPLWHIGKWKIATVTPICKSGGKSEISSYTPMAKLSCISKRFERIEARQLSFLDGLNITPIQHGLCQDDRLPQI